MNFINYSEMAAFMDAGMAKTEITTATANDTKTTTIYAGAPFRKAVQDTPPFEKNANGDLLEDGGSTTTVETWKIRKTIVTEVGTTTTIENAWAEGNWSDRASLTYQYL